MFRLIRGVALIFGLGMVQSFAQTEKTIITLASPQVLPGDLAYVTILLSNSPDVSVSQLQHWIEFPKSKLTYVSVRLGIAADLARAVLNVETKEGSEAPEQAKAGNDTRILHLTVQAEQPIPNGPVVEISFYVAKIQPQAIRLPHRLEAFDVQGEAIPDLDFSDGEVSISHELAPEPPAIFSCLFYMH